MTQITPVLDPATIAAKSTTSRRRPGPILIVGLALLGILAIIAIVAPPLLNDAANTITPQVRQPPSLEHPLGTDSFGQDLLARALVATRLTLLLTLGASAISVVVGVAIGTLVWFVPERVRTVVLALNSVGVAFPSLVLALIIAAILGAGAVPALIAIGIAGIPGFVRLTANMAASVSVKDYMTTARILQVPAPILVVRHLLPNMAEPLLVMMAGHTAFVLVELSGLSFIGLGVQAPDYDYGRLLNDGLVSIYSQPWQIVGPCIMLVISGLAIMSIGDGLAARANPRTSGRVVPATAARAGAVGSRPAPVGTVASVRDLTISSASGAPLVRGVSFDIAPGEIVGLVGESGSGKSLTAMALAGLIADGLQLRADSLVTCGEDLLDGGSTEALARSVSLVYQDPVSTYNPALTIGSQLAEVPRTHLGMSRSEATAALAERFEEVRISNPALRLSQHPHELSGGMLQRAMIASALLTEPKLIIADEPTTALDVSVQADVLRQFYAATTSLGAAMLFISHDLGVVEALCDRVLVMYRGEIVEELTPEQLASRDVKHPYTRKLLAAAIYLEPDTMGAKS